MRAFVAFKAVMFLSYYVFYPFILLLSLVFKMRVYKFIIIHADCCVLSTLQLPLSALIMSNILKFLNAA